MKHKKVTRALKEASGVPRVPIASCHDCGLDLYTKYEIKLHEDRTEHWVRRN